MRRFVVLALSALVLLTAVAPAAAATSTYRYAVRGSGAWASDVRLDGGRFEAAWVEFGDEATRASDGAGFFSYVYFQHLLELCDGSGCVTTYTEGIAQDVAFSIDRKKLLSASIDVLVPATRCVEDASGMTCDEVEVPIQVSWSGYGKVIRSHGTSNGGISGEYQYTLNGAATERWATVSGSVNGFELGSPSAAAALYRTRFAERTIWHG